MRSSVLLRFFFLIAVAVYACRLSADDHSRVLLLHGSHFAGSQYLLKVRDLLQNTSTRRVDLADVSTTTDTQYEEYSYVVGFGVSHPASDIDLILRPDPERFISLLSRNLKSVKTIHMVVAPGDSSYFDAISDAAGKRDIQISIVESAPDQAELSRAYNGVVARANPKSDVVYITHQIPKAVLFDLLKLSWNRRVLTVSSYPKMVSFGLTLGVSSKLAGIANEIDRVTDILENAEPQSGEPSTRVAEKIYLTDISFVANRNAAKRMTHMLPRASWSNLTFVGR